MSIEKRLFYLQIKCNGDFFFNNVIVSPKAHRTAYERFEDERLSSAYILPAYKLGLFFVGLLIFTQIF